MYKVLLTRGRRRSTLTVDAPTVAMARAAVEIAKAPGWTIDEAYDAPVDVRVASKGRGKARKLVVQRNDNPFEPTWTDVGDL